MKRIVKILFVLSFVLFIFSENAYAHVYAAGSDVAQWFPKAALKQYAKSSDVTINKEKYNKNTGIIALAKGNSCDIALSTWQLSELDDVDVLGALKDAKEQGFAFSQKPFVVDAIPPIVNKENPVKKLSLEQLHKIYTGKIKMWNEIDTAVSPDIAIDVYSTSESDGKYIIWKDLVIKGTGSDDIGYGRGPKDMSALIAKDANKWAIGFDSMYYITTASVDIVTITNEEDLKAGPSKEYPVSRYLYAITRNDITDEASNFLDYLLSDEAQKLAKSVNQLPLPKKEPASSGGCNTGAIAILLIPALLIAIERRKQR